MTAHDPVDAGASSPLLAHVRQLIDAARQRVASAVNAELTQLYWHIGRRISAGLLQGQRGEYGKPVVAELARQLTAEFGKGWSEQQLRHCLRLVEVFADEQILSTVQRELSWSHLKALIYMEDPLRRDFYIEICRVERWSVRQLQERINSMLFERTAISKKPEDTIPQDISLLREQGRLSPGPKAPSAWTTNSSCGPRVRPCKPSCIRSLPLLAERWSEMPIHKTLLAAPPAAPSTWEKKCQKHR
jgi:hypothetical protein